ncbi:protein Rae1-like [Drosophila obscura]|uniref:protein Rae1-like n=1 Tax=Drosophila obscura TaxID=7282 RepID=UPI001BB282B1|nr:protein Rae1-like [Drosophila obscura]
MHVRNIPDTTENRKNYDLTCHRQYSSDDSSCDIYAVNDVRVHPLHQSIATVGSDKKFNFWNKAKRCSIYSSAAMDQTITKCAISCDGQLFAYALGYDWSMGHEHCDQNRKSQISLYHCLESMRSN